MKHIDCEMEIHDLSSGLHCPFSVPSHTHHNHLPRGAETARHNSLSFFFIHPYGTLLSLLDIGAERWRALSQDCVPVTATRSSQQSGKHQGAGDSSVYVSVLTVGTCAVHSLSAVLENILLATSSSTSATTLRGCISAAGQHLGRMSKYKIQG